MVFAVDKPYVFKIGLASILLFGVALYSFNQIKRPVIFPLSDGEAEALCVRYVRAHFKDFVSAGDFSYIHPLGENIRVAVRHFERDRDQEGIPITFNCTLTYGERGGKISSSTPLKSEPTNIKTVRRQITLVFQKIVGADGWFIQSAKGDSL